MIHVIGMGDDGPEGLVPLARKCLEEAQLLVASQRLHERIPSTGATRLEWPAPISEAVALLASRTECRIAAVVSGDPLWYSLGNRIARAFPTGERCFHPQVSSFQLAACRLGWAMSEITCATVHGRPITRISPLLGNGQRLLLLTANGDAPGEIARFLTDSGFGATRMSVLSHLGGPDEARCAAIASEGYGRVPDLHVLALELRVSGRTPAAGRAPGLPDTAFEHDGQITKRNVRAATLARLRPMPGATLWDLGCGCGSIAIEWIRSANAARAIGIDRSSSRLGLARQNADRLGADTLSLVEGDVLDALAWSGAPDAVFIGGGLSRDLIGGAWTRLQTGGRMAANAVTWESQQILHDALQRLGGTLVRHSVDTFGQLGGRDAWLPSIPVVQWSVEKFPES